MKIRKKLTDKMLADASQNTQDSVSYLISLILLFLIFISTLILSPHFLFFKLDECVESFFRPLNLKPN